MKRQSYLAAYIDREYRMRQKYEKKKQRVKCKEKECNKCQFHYICGDKNDT